MEGALELKFSFPNRPDLNPTFMRVEAGYTGFIYSCLDSSPLLYTVVAAEDCTLFVMTVKKLMEVGAAN